tara:strand:- start:6079 stop:6654 length:576 start_codon:yes stop_codon:yes gene_type:complete
MDKWASAIPIRDARDRAKFAKGGKAESQRSLDQWTGEEWDNVSGKKGDRYLPKKVREGMTPGQKAAENRKKRQATKSGKQVAKYSDSLKKSMRSKGVYKEGGKTPAWQRKEGKDPKGGLNRKGVESYRRANPGSKLQTAVTTKPSKLKKGSKAAKRRKSFCARMKGMRKRQKPSNNTGKDRLSLSLKKWNC